MNADADQMQVPVRHVLKNPDTFLGCNTAGTLDLRQI